MYIDLVGYPFNSEIQGYIEIDPTVRYDPDPSGNDATTDWRPDWIYPLMGCIPIANVVMGLWHIGVGLFADPRYENIATKDILKYRVLKVLVGAAEITLVGGCLVHGIATLYFYKTRPTEEEARRILIERDAEQMSNV